MYFILWWFVGMVSVGIIEYFENGTTEYTLKYISILALVGLLGPIITLFMVYSQYIKAR